MGSVILTKSGIFRPSDYGLNIGDTIYVVAVGGGGGGGVPGNNGNGWNTNGPTYTTGLRGGTGGTTTFGTELTALGGGGGGTWCSTTSYTQYAIPQLMQGNAIAASRYGISDNNTTIHATGGAYGWIPDIEGYSKQCFSFDELIYPDTDGNRYLNYDITMGGLPAGHISLGTYIKETAKDTFTTYYPNKYYIYSKFRNINDGALGFPPLSTFANSGSTSNVCSKTLWKPYAVCGGCGTRTYITGEYPNASNYNLVATGGAGYGAGGAGAGNAQAESIWYDTSGNVVYLTSSGCGGAGGNSGEIKKKFITLTSNEYIVGVGGGGSGAGVYNQFNTTSKTLSQGVNGTTGAGGALDATLFDNYGGYGDNPSGGDGNNADRSQYDTAAKSANRPAKMRTVAAGGGASGCVAIYW